MQKTSREDIRTVALYIVSFEFCVLASLFLAKVRKINKLGVLTVALFLTTIFLRSLNYLIAKLMTKTDLEFLILQTLSAPLQSASLFVLYFFIFQLYHVKNQILS